MAEYNIKRAEVFGEKIIGLPEADMFKVWAACTELISDSVLRSDLCRIVNEFFELPIWERQAVLYGLADVVHIVAKKAAYDLSQRAREEDPI